MNQRITREDWLQAALQALAEGGIAALAVEPLARRLKVTKGSFYNYFGAVDALFAELIALWEEAGTAGVIQAVEAIPDPAERLRQLFVHSWDRVDHLKAEAALMAAAVAGDPRVRPAFLRVNRRRLAFTQRLYRQLGLSRAEALRWALTAYGAYLGTLQLVALESGAFRSHAHLRAHAEHLGRTLVPPAPAPPRAPTRRSPA